MPIEKSFPSLFVDAERVSLGGQRGYMIATSSALLAALIASAASTVEIDIRLGEAAVRLGALLAGTAFLVGIASAVYAIQTKPERAWYRGRAAAESIRTLCWQYVVGGGSFGRGDEAEAERRLIERLREVAASASAAQLDIAAIGGQISPDMRVARSASLEERVRTYLAERIDVQNMWYVKRARRNRQRANLWLTVALVFQVGGLMLAAARTFKLMDVDFFGVAATAAAGASAWMQTKDYLNLAEAYSATARDLALVRTEGEAFLQKSDEASWRVFVEYAEQAVSREHTLWLARRGEVALQN